MRKLFIIDGAMRPAKNELVRHLTRLEKNLPGGSFSTVCLARKLSTSPDSEYQDRTYCKDLINQIEGNEEKWISYMYEDHTYGLTKDYLDELIKKHENVFLIARNTELVFELKNLYSRHTAPPVKVITVYIYSDKKAIEDSYSKNNASEITLEERKRRLTRSDIDYENAMALFENYDETIIYTKKDGSGSASLAVKINALIYKYKNTIESYSIFFIQSFHNAVNNAEQIYGCLQKAAQNAFKEDYSSDCVSLIKGKGSYKIGETIWEMIDKSDYIVCDITPDRCKDCQQLEDADKNNMRVSPNIWLELGYTLCNMKLRSIPIGRKLLITCKCDSKNISLPADIRDINVICYQNYDDFTTQVTSHLKGLKSRD